MLGSWGTSGQEGGSLGVMPSGLGAAFDLVSSLQGQDGAKGDRGEDGEPGQPVSDQRPPPPQLEALHPSSVLCRRGSQSGSHTFTLLPPSLGIPWSHWGEWATWTTWEAGEWAGRLGPCVAALVCGGWRQGQWQVVGREGLVSDCAWWVHTCRSGPSVLLCAPRVA